MAKWAEQEAKDEDMNTEFDMLSEFIRTFKASLDPRLWIKLIKEEVAEYEEASLAGDRVEMLKEIADVVYVKVGFLGVIGGGLGDNLLTKSELDDWNKALELSGDRVKEAEALFGWDTIMEAFKRVHLSNMSKLGVDGKPIFREDGKVLKGPNYKKPYLTDLIEA